MRWIAAFIAALAKEDGESEVMLTLVVVMLYGAAVASAVWWLLTT